MRTWVAVVVACPVALTSCSGGGSDHVHALDQHADVTVLVEPAPDIIAGVGFGGTFVVHDGCLMLRTKITGPPPRRRVSVGYTPAILPEGTQLVSAHPLVLQGPHIGRVTVGTPYGDGGQIEQVPAIGHCPASGAYGALDDP